MIQSPSPEQVRQITESVLARPEFRPEPSPFAWVERFLDWLFRDLPLWAAANPIVGKLLIVVLTIILIALLAHIGYLIVRENRNLKTEDPGSRAGTSSIEALAEIAPSWNQAVPLAREALEAGNLHRALWIAHRILLSTLDRMELVAFKRWKTNTDYLTECHDTGTAGGLLSDLTLAYERVIYAHDAFERERAARLLARVEALAGRVGQ